LRFVGPLKWTIDICLPIIRKDLWMDEDKGTYFGGRSLELVWSFERGLGNGPLSFLFEELWKNVKEDCCMKEK